MSVTTLFVDIGGVFLTDGRGHEFRKMAVKEFHLNLSKKEDAFISSCYVGLRKPDSDSFRLALDIAQLPTEQIVYIENTPMFAGIAGALGIRGIWHTDYKSTCEQLTSFGMEVEL